MKTLQSEINIFLRKNISLALHMTDTALGRANNQIIVINYHSISSDNWYHSVSLDNLKRQVLYLKNAGFRFLTLAELGDIIEEKKAIKGPAVVFTFDDGYKNIMTTRSFFKKLKIKPAVFLLGDQRGVRRDELDNNIPLLSKNDISQLIHDGWYVGSHSQTHAKLDLLSVKELYDEVVVSKMNLEKELKKKIYYFAYPKGRYSKSVKALVKKSGYTFAFTMDDGFIDGKTNPYKVPRIGINTSHSLSEFKTLWSPSVVGVRGFMKGVLSV